MWEIHALIIHKEVMDKARANKIAKDILKKKAPVRETEDSWRFDNIPKEKFKKFRSQEIHKGLTLIFGELI